MGLDKGEACDAKAERSVNLQSAWEVLFAYNWFLPVIVISRDLSCND